MLFFIKTIIQSVSSYCKYSNHLNTRLVWYSNAVWKPDWKSLLMVQMSSIQMVRHVEWLDHFNIWTPVLSSFHTNQVFGIDMVTLSIFKPKCPIIEILHHPDGKCGQENIFVRAKRLSCIRMSRGFTFSSSLQICANFGIYTQHAYKYLLMRMRKFVFICRLWNFKKFA